MKEKKEQKDMSEEELLREEPAAEAEVPAEAESTEESELARLSAELAAGQDKYLRMLAEYDNYRKRTQKEKECAYADGLADAIAELLPVLDNLGRAAAVEDPSKIAEGLGLTLKGADSALAKLKIEEIAKVGDTFDPTVHNAVMHVEDEAYGEGEIVEVFQRGYRRGDKIIREAMVKVAN